MSEEELRLAIRRLAVDGKAACKSLLELAKTTGTPPWEIGTLCNELKIHIAGCQLGCFR